MSNLIKQTYIVNSNTEKRVINSNSLIREKLDAVNNNGGLRFSSFDSEESEGTEYDEANEAFDEDGGFQQGIEAEMVEVEPELTPEEILEAANSQAEEILLNARREAEAIRSQAAEEAEELKQKAKAKAYEEGLVEKEQALVEKEEQIDALIQNRSMELEDEYSQRFEIMERDIVNAITSVIEQVFHVQFREKKEIIFALIQKTVLNVEVGKNFRIKVSEANRQYVEEKVEQIQAQLGKDVSIEVSQDISLDDESCLVETDFGVFDCGIDTQMKNLLKEIKRLSN